MSDPVPTLEGTPKIRECQPERCSSCYGQYPDRRHVDFGADWEGPAFKDDSVAGGLWQHADNLILCEDCLERGIDALGFQLDKRAGEQAKLLEAENQNLRDRLAAAMTYIDQAEQEQRARASLVEQLTTATEE